MRLLPAVFFSLAVGACSGKDQDSKQWIEKVMPPTEKSLEVPRAIQSVIDQQFVRKFRETEKAQVLTDDQIQTKRTKAYLDVQIFLEGQARETLGGNLKFQSTRGGGKFSVRDLIQENRGSFYLRFEVTDPETTAELSDYDLYFWSTAKPKRIKDEIYGLDCGTLLKLDPASFQNKGLHLNATNGRYAPVVEGIYYFAHYKGARLAIAALQIGEADELESCLR